MNWSYVSKEYALSWIIDKDLKKHKDKNNWYNLLGELVLSGSGDIWMGRLS